jgi:hypothetical protein
MQLSENTNGQPHHATWRFWSTTESIQCEVPSVTAIVETIVAVPLYWWVTLRFGTLLPLLISVVVAPLVLLRSEQSVAVGARWFLQCEEVGDHHLPIWLAAGVSAAISLTILYIFLPPFIESMPPNYSRILAAGIFGAFVFGVPLLLLIFSIRFFATLSHVRTGLKMLPGNFRRLCLCTSPYQLPELIPGLEGNSYTAFSFHSWITPTVGDLLFIIRPSWSFGYLKNASLKLPLCLGGFLGLGVIFLPSWLYRLTLKSTAWFWWPLAFLGDDLKKARDPEQFHLDVMCSLWARTTFVMSCISVVVFLVTNLALSGAIFEGNPLLTPLGYLLLLHWPVPPWQACAVIGSVLSVAVVFMLDKAMRKYELARKRQDSALQRNLERSLGWIERLARLRLMFLVVFWLLVGTHTVLYVNSQHCWLSLSPEWQDWARYIYGNRVPTNCST